MTKKKPAAEKPYSPKKPLPKEAWPFLLEQLADELERMKPPMKLVFHDLGDRFQGEILHRSSFEPDTSFQIVKNPGAIDTLRRIAKSLKTNTTSASTPSTARSRTRRAMAGAVTRSPKSG